VSLAVAILAVALSVRDHNIDLTRRFTSGYFLLRLRRSKTKRHIFFSTMSEIRNAIRLVDEGGIMKILYMVVLLVLISVAATAQVKNTENTVKLAEGQTSAKATISDIAWLTGAWSGTGLGGVSEEVWSKANNGVMVGTYRLIVDNKPVFYEMMWMIEVEGTIILRLKHFSPELVGWEEKDKTVDFKFVDKQGDRMRFSGLTFEKVGDKGLNIYLALRQKDGSLKEERFVMTKGN